MFKMTLNERHFLWFRSFIYDVPVLKYFQGFENT